MDINELLVIVPVYNESNIIKCTLQNLKSAGIQNILVVNDGSTDDSLLISKSLEVKVISHKVNLGYGAAILSGFDYFLINKKWNYVATIDADGQHKVSDLLKLCSKYKEGKILIGSRKFILGKSPLDRMLINFLADVSTSLLSGSYIKDSQSGMRVMSYNVLSKLTLNSHGYSLCSEILTEAYKKKISVVTIPIEAIYTRYSLNKPVSQKVSGAYNTFKDLLNNI